MLKPIIGAIAVTLMTGSLAFADPGNATPAGINANPEMHTGPGGGNVHPGEYTNANAPYADTSSHYYRHHRHHHRHHRHHHHHYSSY